jgi:pyrroline-5-carboxylate reductase
LNIFNEGGFTPLVQKAVNAAKVRAGELAKEFS